MLGRAEHRSKSSNNFPFLLLEMMYSDRINSFELEVLMGKIEIWKSQLPINDINSSEKILSEIFGTVNNLMQTCHLLESEVSTLRTKLEAEILKRKKLEVQVAYLTARDTDLKALNYLMDVFGLLKNFIMRVEMSNAKYSSEFRKLNDRDVIDSLFVAPIHDILDSHQQKEKKTFLSKHTAEAKTLFENLELDAKLVFDLNQKFYERNLSTHSLNNKLFKDADYVQDKLADFLTVVDGLTAGNELAPEKDSIVGLVNRMRVLHVDTLNTLGLQEKRIQY